MTLESVTSMTPEATISKRRFKSSYWDVPPVGYEHVTTKEYKAMQASGQIPHSVVNPSSQHLQGTRFAHGHHPARPASPPAAATTPMLDHPDRHHNDSRRSVSPPERKDYHSSDRPDRRHVSRSSRHNNNHHNHHHNYDSDEDDDRDSYRNGGGSHALRKSTRVENPLEVALEVAKSINAALATTTTTTTTTANKSSLLGLVTTGSVGALAPAMTRQARRLYIGNIPFGCTNEEMVEFFETNMIACNFISAPGNPVLACQINLDKNFAFLEFRTVEEAAQAMALDGIQFKSQTLKIRRPHDYHPIPGSEPTPAPIGSQISSLLASSSVSAALAEQNKVSAGVTPVQYEPGVVSSIVADSPNKIYIGSLPTYLTDDQVRELLTTFGKLRAFNLVKDPVTGQSKGYAFCEYLDTTITDQAIIGLNGTPIGDKKLVVQRASVGAKSGPLTGLPGVVGGATSASAVAAAVAAAAASAGIGLGGVQPPVQIQVPGMQNQASLAPRVLSPILCLMNMVEPDELRDDEEYADIVEDIRAECAKYGTVLSIEIPRPAKRPPVDDDDIPPPPPVPGLGKVFVEFDSPTEAQRTQQNIAGRRFGSRIVVTSFFDADRYKSKEF